MFPNFAKASWALTCVLFLAACSSSPTWSLKRMHTSQTEYNSARLTYSAQNKVHDIGLELFRTTDGLQLFLVIHGQPVPVDKDHPSEVNVHLITKERDLTGLAVRYGGGQRFKVSPELQEEILASLKGEHQITIELPGYRSMISGEGFSRYLENLQSTPFFQNPLRSPI